MGSVTSHKATRVAAVARKHVKRSWHAEPRPQRRPVFRAQRCLTRSRLPTAAALCRYECLSALTHNPTQVHNRVRRPGRSDNRSAIVRIAVWV